MKIKTKQMKSESCELGLFGTISIHGCFCCFVLTLHFTKKIIYWNLHYIAVKKKKNVEKSTEVQQVAI